MVCSLSLHDLALGARKAKSCLRLVPLAAQGSPWLPSLCSSCKVKGGMGQAALGWKVVLIISKVQDLKIRRTSRFALPLRASLEILSLECTCALIVPNIVCLKKKFSS